MIVVAGSRVFQNPLGYVMDFCPFCRDLRPMLLLEKVEQSTLYGSAVGTARTKDHLVTCTRCECTHEGHPDRYREVFSEEQTIDAHLGALEPSVLMGLAERARLEERFRRDQLSRDDRLALLAEPLRALEPAVDGSLGGMTPSALSVIAVLSLVAAFFSCLIPVNPAWPTFLVDLAWFSLMGLCALLTVFSVLCDRRRYFRSNLNPVLVAMYQPLAPDPSEIEEVKTQLRRECRVAAKHLDVEKLHRDLMAEPSISEAPKYTDYYRRLLVEGETQLEQKALERDEKRRRQETLNRVFYGAAREYQRSSIVPHLVILGSVCLSFAIVAMCIDQALRLRGISTSITGILFGVAFVAPGPIALWILFRSQQLLIGKVLPCLKSVVEELNASRAEVEEALNHLQAHKLPLGFDLKIDAVLKDSGAIPPGPGNEEPREQ